MADAVALRLHLSEDAPQLFAVQEQVVGPFDPRRHSRHLADRPHHGHGRRQGDLGQFHGGQHRAQHQGDVEPDSRGGIPLPAQPAPASGLGFRHHDGAFRDLDIPPARLDEKVPDRDRVVVLLPGIGPVVFMDALNMQLANRGQAKCRKVPQTFLDLSLSLGPVGRVGQIGQHAGRARGVDTVALAFAVREEGLFVGHATLAMLVKQGANCFNSGDVRADAEL